jgi:hypothetical protein
MNNSELASGHRKQIRHWTEKRVDLDVDSVTGSFEAPRSRCFEDRLQQTVGNAEVVPQVGKHHMITATAGLVSGKDPRLFVQETRQENRTRATRRQDVTKGWQSFVSHAIDVRKEGPERSIYGRN